MDNKNFKRLIDEKLKISGFKKKGNNWYQESEQLIKVINLQKSNFGNYYYINYGFIIKGLDLQEFYTHIDNRLGSTDKEENKKTEETLNLENEVENEVRRQNLNELLDNLLKTISAINTQEDLLRDLKKRPHLNDVPLIVKRHFKLV